MVKYTYNHRTLMTLPFDLCMLNMEMALGQPKSGQRKSCGAGRVSEGEIHRRETSSNNNNLFHTVPERLIGTLSTAQVSKCHKTHTAVIALDIPRQRWINVGSTRLKWMTAAGVWLADTRELPCRPEQRKCDYLRHVLQNESCSVLAVALFAAPQAVSILRS